MSLSCRSSCFNSTGRPSGPTAFALALTFIAVAIFSSVGSILRALATGYCESLFGMSGSRVSDFVFNGERKNLTKIRIFVPQQSPFLVTDVLRLDISRLLQLHRFDILEESMLVSHAQLLLQLNDGALEETNDRCTSHFLQPLKCMPDGPLQLPIYGVNF